MRRDYHKRCKPPIKSSVMARLMGLDGLSHHQPLHIHQRVLSDNYIQKAATLGQRQGRSVYAQHSRDTNNEILQGASGLQTCKNKNLFTLEQHPHMDSSTVEMDIGNQKDQHAYSSKPTVGVSYEDRNSVGKRIEHHAPEYALRYLQKLEDDSFTAQIYDLGIGYAKNFLKFQSKMIDNYPLFSSTGISMLKSKTMKVTENKFGDEEVNLPSRSENREVFRSESGKCRCKSAYNLLLDNDFVSNSHHFTTQHRTLNRMHKIFRCSSRDSSMPLNNGASYISDPRVLLPSFSGTYDHKKFDSTPHLLSDQSSFRGRHFETFQKGKEMQSVEVSGFSVSHYDIDFSAEMVMRKSLRKRHVKNGFCLQCSKRRRNSGFCSPSAISSIKFKEHDHVKNLQLSESEAINGTLLGVSNLNQVETRDGNRKSHKEEISQGEIKETRCGSSRDNFSSPELNFTITQSVKIVDVSSCCFSYTNSEKDAPKYDAKSLDGTANCSWNNTIPKMECSQKILHNYIDDKLANTETFNGGVSSMICEDKSESDPGIFSTKDVKSSSVTDAFSSETSINELSEEKLAYSNYSRGPSEFQRYLKGIDCSPSSVLEPFDFPNSAAIQCLETTDQQLQLQAFNPTSEKTCSHGSEMGISGDEEETVESMDNVSITSLMVGEWLREGESRNFSYMADVLDEAGFYSEKLTMDIESWHCLDCPISPMVFEVLEKKYGRQTSWHKSDRLLLFDLINSGLIGIVNEIINFHTAASSIRRFMPLMRDEVEENLWMKIIREKDKSIDMSDQAVEDAMKWLDVDEEINIMSGKMESSLFDELVIESISLWNS